MCGIWGIVNKRKTISVERIKSIIKDLMVLSENRGKEASGIAILNSDRMAVLKRSVAANKLIGTAEYGDLINRNIKDGEEHLILGHSRLVTNGISPQNNQPVVKYKIGMVHNGIIVNDEELWKKNGELTKELEVDTEIMVEMFNYYLKENNITDALGLVYNQICGMASTISILLEQRALIAASNNGSLYYWESEKKDIAILASERLTIEKIIYKYGKYLDIQKNYSIRQLNNGNSRLWNLCTIENAENREVEIQEDRQVSKVSKECNIFREQQVSKYDIDFERIKKIRRCTRCVLPETMPFIQFDKDGVCNYCRSYQKQSYKGEKSLREWAERINKQSRKNNCMVSFSGGRDSSYGLHYFVKELNLKPITYCYDWGMVTDLARRNQSRMCSKLGVEFILVSADIRRKRVNIRKNILAWLRKPDLGMVPIFMAGDKHYFYYANKVCKDYGINNILLASNPFEKTFFKSGFCGVQPDFFCKGRDKLEVERLPGKDVLKMILYYAEQYGKNVKYINSSLFDTLTAAASYYIIPHNYFRLFDYIEWREDKVNKILLEEYDWETANDTNSTWRIGDGTAPFYNYIYCLIAGFSENDTLRSNQIREGMLTREEALRLVYQDNAPRFEALKWYFDILNLDMQVVLNRINDMPRLYH